MFSLSIFYVNKRYTTSAYTQCVYMCVYLFSLSLSLSLYLSTEWEKSLSSHDSFCAFSVYIGGVSGVANNLFQLQKNKLHDNLFKVIPLKCATLSHSSLPLFFVLLKGFFWDASLFGRYSLFGGLHAFKKGFREYPIGYSLL